MFGPPNGILNDDVDNAMDKEERHGDSSWVIMKLGSWIFYGYKLDKSFVHSMQIVMTYPVSIDVVAIETSNGLKFEMVRAELVYGDEQS